MEIVNWDKEFSNGRDYTLLKAKTISDIYNLSVKHNSFLDIGCGTGQLTREMYHKGFTEIVGVDGSKVAIHIATQATITPITYAQVNLNSSFAEKIPQTFDLVTCKYTLAFIKNIDLFFQEVQKLLALDGRFVIISPTRDSLSRERWYITVDTKKVTQKIQEYFILDNHFIEGNDEFYICKNK